MACSIPHSDDEIQALVQKQIDEDMVHQKAIMDLALQFDNACTTKEDLRKAYEKLHGTIHCKVLDVGSYENDITVGAAKILANVSVFTPKPSKHYLNITKRNVVEEELMSRCLPFWNFKFDVEDFDRRPSESIMRATEYLEVISDMKDFQQFVGSALIDMYSKCGRIEGALGVFEEYCEADCYVDACCYWLPAECQLLNMMTGCCVHEFLIKMGFEDGLSLCNALLNFYVKTGSVDAAAMLFKEIKDKHGISWASMVSCYAHNGAGK
nr:hypothetical protein [Tanacetum cinerariifolium]